METRSFQPRPLGEQVIVITGGSSGIGLATALHAASEGAQVVLVARGASRLADAARRVAMRGAAPLTFSADVTDRPALDAVVASVLAQAGRIDTWVNNAGVAVYGAIADLQPAEFERVIAVDLLGVVNGTQAVLPAMAREGGTVVAVGSVLSEVTVPLLGAYAAAKHGVRAFTEALRLEVADAGLPIAVRLIEPSTIDTPFFEHARSRMGRAARPIPPVTDPAVVAGAILRAASGGPDRVVVGGAGRAFTLLGRLSPALAAALLRVGRMGWVAQQDDRPPPAVDNLFQASPGPARVRGSR
jgi:NAD(P)-dependent dehydrogenase (short-subunit alcohol dehydrogenase family)